MPSKKKAPKRRAAKKPAAAARPLKRKACQEDSGRRSAEPNIEGARRRPDIQCLEGSGLGRSPK